ncbi:hypothetical protein DXV75_01635 [Alteromonas aestuariivivens]|uniref:Uncharacterized protein n=1 Tax=Alteromonas aestuariivivens TaxID=1938339 RepID=A0A3D8MG40_9ALTE|nr:hypothetical protein [Alteromonas aestuariivivens]RDV29188.1 hypothetical protein DXV75_01635 [Alteromonas aestuariivivens]
MVYLAYLLPVIVSLSFAGLAVYLLAAFPMYQWQLALFGLVYAAGSCYFSRLWLYVLPVLTVGLNLAPWTGRYVADELDFFVLLTLAVASAKRDFGVHLAQRSKLVAIAFVALCIFVTQPFDFVGLFEPMTTNFYHTPLFGAAILKGIVYALLLSWLLQAQFQQHSEKTLNHFLCAGLLTTFVLFVLVLWERGILATWASDSGLWLKLHALANFSSIYRITGQIAGMHTGGESLDGILLFLAPVNLMAVMYFRSSRSRFISLLAMGCLLYCILVGFTRATYAATAIGLATVAAMYWWSVRGRNSGANELATVVLYAALLLGTFLVFQRAGYYALIASGGLLVASLWITQQRGVLKAGYWPAMVGVALVFLLIAVKSYLDSRWIEQSLAQSVWLAAGIIVCLVSTLALARRSPEAEPVSQVLFRGGAYTLVAAVMVTSLSGSRITIRNETIWADLQTRLTHWQAVLDSGEPSLTAQFLGNGLGSFPLNHALNNIEVVAKDGTFSVSQGQGLLELDSGGDLQLGQRVNVTPGGEYSLQFRYRARGPAGLLVKVCQRNLIIFEHWAGNCTTEKFRFEPSQEFKTVSKQIKLDSFDASAFALPATFLIGQNNSSGKTGLTGLALLDGTGNNLISNGDFSAGMDQWFFYHDFSHLPWHIKNLYVSVYYQLGFLGCVLFVVICVMGIGRYRHSGTVAEGALRITFLGILAAYLAFGFFGDPTDSARANMWFYLAVFTQALLLKAHSEVGELKR